MRRTIITLAVLLGTISLFAQKADSSWSGEMRTIQNTVLQQQKEIDSLAEELTSYKYLLNQQKASIGSMLVQSSSQNKTIDSLNQIIQDNSKNIISSSNELGAKIDQSSESTDAKISKVDETVNKNLLYWLLGTLGILLLGVLMYLLLGKKISSSKTEVEKQIKNTKQSLEEESVKLDNKLIEILNTQLKIQENNNHSSQKEDHSLALKVADEIVRMQKNISRMDSKTKGLKPLLKGLERIQNNFAANGYEMINLLNMDYDDRMNIDVINFIEDENLETGKKIITKIIKPQVNYKDVLIQRAQVEVSQN